MKGPTRLHWTTAAPSLPEGLRPPGGSPDRIDANPHCLHHLLPNRAEAAAKVEAGAGRQPTCMPGPPPRQMQATTSQIHHRYQTSPLPGPPVFSPLLSSRQPTSKQPQPKPSLTSSRRCSRMPASSRSPPPEIERLLPTLPTCALPPHPPHYHPGPLMDFASPVVTMPPAAPTLHDSSPPALIYQAVKSSGLPNYRDA